MTTAAFRTAAIMRRRMRVCRTCFTLPLMTGSPVGLLELLLEFPQRHFLPLVPLPVLE